LTNKSSFSSLLGWGGAAFNGVYDKLKNFQYNRGSHFDFPKNELGTVKVVGDFIQGGVKKLLAPQAKKGGWNIDQE
jgi:hypothetical protein